MNTEFHPTHANQHHLFRDLGHAVYDSLMHLMGKHDSEHEATNDAPAETESDMVTVRMWDDRCGHSAAHLRGKNAAALHVGSLKPVVSSFASANDACFNDIPA